jgi:hypothetical protein
MQQFLGAWRASGGTNTKLTPRLRTFHPALLLAALQGQVEGAHAIAAEVEGLGIDGLELTGGMQGWVWGVWLGKGWFLCQCGTGSGHAT